MPRTRQPGISGFRFLLVIPYSTEPTPVFTAVLSGSIRSSNGGGSPSTRRTSMLTSGFTGHQLAMALLAPDSATAPQTTGTEPELDDSQRDAARSEACPLL